MNKKNQQNISLILSVVLAITAGIWIIATRPETEAVTHPLTTTIPATTKDKASILGNPVSKSDTGLLRNPVSKLVLDGKTILFTLTAGDISITLNPVDGTTLYDALIQAGNEGKINLIVKDYPGLGFYVTDIGSLHEVSGKHLIYYVNGKEATVGVSLYMPKEGDIISWKLE